MLLFSILAVTAGATSLRRIAMFIEERLPQLREVYSCTWRQAPSHTSLLTIFSALDPVKVEQALGGHAQQLAQQQQGQETCFIALDGKTLRGSLNHLEHHQAAQVLSALAVDQTVVLGQRGLMGQDKGGEIEAGRQLMERLGVKGCVFTLDALHAKKTVEHIKASGNKLIVQLKANQPTLLQQAQDWVEDHPYDERRRQPGERRHGRFESREVELYPLPSGFGENDWQGQWKALVVVQRYTQVRATTLRG